MKYLLRFRVEGVDLLRPGRVLSHDEDIVEPRLLRRRLAGHRGRGLRAAALDHGLLLRALEPAIEAVGEKGHQRVVFREVKVRLEALRRQSPDGEHLRQLVVRGAGQQVENRQLVVGSAEARLHFPDEQGLEVGVESERGVVLLPRGHDGAGLVVAVGVVLDLSGRAQVGEVLRQRLGIEGVAGEPPGDLVTQPPSLQHRRRRRLLADVGQFMGNQALPLAAAWGVLAGAEDHVGADGVGARVDGAGAVRGLRIGVHPNAAEVESQALLHLRAGGLGERVAAAAQHWSDLSGIDGGTRRSVACPLQRRNRAGPTGLK